MEILAICEPSDLKHVYLLKPLLGRNNTLGIISSPVFLLTRIKELCKLNKTNKVICMNNAILKKLVRQHDPIADLSIVTNADYRGSLFYLDQDDKSAPPIEILILPPAKTLRFERGASWIHTRWIQKLTNPNFPVFPELDWKILTPDNLDVFLDQAKHATMIGIDIETKQVEIDPKLVEGDPESFRGIWSMWKKTAKKTVPAIPVITMVGYTLLLKRPGINQYYSTTGVLLIRNMVDVYYMRMLNSTLPPKVMQNGGYDSTYFLRYNAPVHNYLYDTFIGMHAWVAELKRNLSFITSLFNKNSIHWKDEGARDTPQYCAKDVHNTTWSMVHMLLQMPDWAKENYFENFRMQFPCISCGVEGWKVDPEEKLRLRSARVEVRDSVKARLGNIIYPNFNPNSPKQVVHMLRGFGLKKANTAKESAIKAFMEKHPLFDLLGGLILDYKEQIKAIGTYFDFCVLNGRLMYELNPAGTDTGRLASKKSNFWIGTQIQNIPGYAKSMLVADDGWKLFSADNCQSESRCTAYESEDENLIEAVESPLDFHKVNCTKFFGVGYDEVTGDIRDTGKRVNHGANYNMGASVMLETMGTQNVVKAKTLLKLPGSWSLYHVCEYLLECFEKAYPKIKGKWYKEIVRSVQLTGKLVGSTGWTRLCFGDPVENKLDLNAYVAHVPQSLSVKLINAAFFDLWLQLQIRERKVRFKAQVHDDIIGQCRQTDNSYVLPIIRARMAAPVTIRGREMIIPNDAVWGGTTWADLKSKTFVSPPLD